MKLRNTRDKIRSKGLCSDKSLDKGITKQLEFKIENEGEFCLCFENFYNHFNSIRLCHLIPGKI